MMLKLSAAKRNRVSRKQPSARRTEKIGSQMNRADGRTSTQPPDIERASPIFESYHHAKGAAEIVLKFFQMPKHGM
jgi:hypothetical protein